MPSEAEKVEVHLTVHVLQRLQTNIFLNFTHNWFFDFCICPCPRYIFINDILSEQKDCSIFSIQLFVKYILSLIGRSAIHFRLGLIG